MSSIPFSNAYVVNSDGLVTKVGDILKLVYVSASWSADGKLTCSRFIFRCDRDGEESFAVSYRSDELYRLTAFDAEKGDSLNFVVADGIVSNGDPLKINIGDDVIRRVHETVLDCQNSGNAIGVIYATDKAMNREPGRGTSYRQLVMLRNSVKKDV